jgi:2-hydroxy-3-keto-5-methylthiopentenyl-1-phosphate phosphatase
MECMIFVDSDGTITLQDTCDAMMDCYGNQAWREIDQKWAEGKISTQEAARAIFQHIRIREEEVRAFARTIGIDTGFIPFVAFCHTMKWPVTILSDGYDIFISTILEQHGLSHIPYYSNQMIFNGDRLDIRCPYYHPDYPWQGVAKARIMRDAVKDKRKAVFIGDGLSDIYAAEVADILFAKGALEGYCRENALSFYPFDTFKDVERTIREIAGK